VVKNGRGFEKIAIERNAANPAFAFLTGGLGHTYYRRCIDMYSGDATERPREQRPQPTASASAAQSTAAVLASLSAEKASELLKKALQAIPLSEKMAFNSDLKSKLDEGRSGAAGGAGDDGLIDPRLAAQQQQQQQASSAGQASASPLGALSSSSYQQQPYHPLNMKMNMNSGSRRVSVDPRLSAVSAPPPQQQQQPRSRSGGGGGGGGGYSSSSSSQVKGALIELVKQFLSGPWKEKIISREAFKTICKKVVDKVLAEAFPGRGPYPGKKEEVSRFLTGGKRKEVKALVEGYVTKYRT